MEKKYNSLKEALPSLLEEKARLEEEKSRLEIRKAELVEELAELVKEVDDVFRNDLDVLEGEVVVLKSAILRLRIEMATSRNENNKLLNEHNKLVNEHNELLKELRIFIDKAKALTRLEKILHCIILNLSFEINWQLLGQLRIIVELIKTIQDISLIADIDFKTKFKNYQHLFCAAFNDILATNNLAWIYKFSKNNDDLLNGNMSALIEKVKQTNIPAYMYLVAVKINNIPDEDMKYLITAIVTSEDRKYIDYLLLALQEKGISEELRSFITSLNISIDAATMFNYDENFADELEQALLEDNLEVLYKHGMYSYEDRAYVLSNIQAGL